MSFLICGSRVQELRARLLILTSVGGRHHEAVFGAQRFCERKIDEAKIGGIGGVCAHEHNVRRLKITMARLNKQVAIFCIRVWPAAYRPDGHEDRRRRRPAWRSARPLLPR